MNKINVPIEIPENMDNFLKLLPLNIRKKYMSKMTSAVIKENEKEIINSVSNIVQEMMNVLISSKDENILQEELDRALEDIGVTMFGDKKTIKGRKKKVGETLKKSNLDGSEDIQPTVLKDDIKNQVDSLKSDSKKDQDKRKVASSNDLNFNNKKENVLDYNKKDNNESQVKKLDLESMFSKK